MDDTLSPAERAEAQEKQKIKTCSCVDLACFDLFHSHQKKETFDFLAYPARNFSAFSTAGTASGGGGVREQVTAEWAKKTQNNRPGVCVFVCLKCEVWSD